MFQAFRASADTPNLISHAFKRAASPSDQPAAPLSQTKAARVAAAQTSPEAEGSSEGDEEEDEEPIFSPPRSAPRDEIGSPANPMIL